MKEFWEIMFSKEKTTWGFEPSDSAIIAKDFFLDEKAKEILITGIGYGRNAKVGYPDIIINHQTGLQHNRLKHTFNIVNMRKDILYPQVTRQLVL